MNVLIFHIGGRFDRIETTIELAKESPNAKILLSVPDYPLQTKNRLDMAGIDESRYMFEYDSWDTVSQFWVNRERILRHIRPDVLITTSDYDHLFQRIYGLSELTLKGHGIKERIFVPHKALAGNESFIKSELDFFRMSVWNKTGWKIYNPFIKKRRMPQLQIWKDEAKNAFPHLLVK